MSAAPIYRQDVKGSVREAIAEFEAVARNQIAHTDIFILAAEDLPAYDEYAVYLTPAEMKAAAAREPEVAT